MPNNCQNRLTIAGRPEDVDAFVKKVNGPCQHYKGSPKAKESVFSFHQIVPIPDEVMEGKYDPNGYEAEHTLWGVKWGAYKEKLESHEPGRVIYTFTTAWGVAMTFFWEASKLFPTLKFYISYSCEGPSRGRFTWESGSSTELGSDY